MDVFLTGLELNELFFREAVGPLLAAEFPDLAYSAALIGYGSDVLGYDTALSADHEWGPRLLLFLDESEESAEVADALDQTFKHHLPPMFRGYSTNFSPPDPAGGGVRRLAPIGPGASSSINHHIQLLHISTFLRHELSVDTIDHLSMGDWLVFPEQKLLEVTAGAVYYDGLGRLRAVREQLAYYPHDIWLYRLAAQWRRIAQEEAFVGRCGDVGDELGSQLVAAHLVRELIRLCFLFERRYAPYSKWLGTAFGRLACAQQVGPQLSAVLTASTWQQREEHLARVYETLARTQNALAVAEPQDPNARWYYGRPYQVIMADRFVSALTAAIQDSDVRRIMERLPLAGALDQWADSTDILQHAAVCRRVGRLVDFIE